MEDKKRGVKLVLLFFVIAIMLASAIFLFLKGRTPTNTVIGESSPPFKVDQILLKVLIKEDESMARPINIMDISNYDLYIEIEVQNLYDIVSVSNDKFALKTGQTKTVYINFSSFIKKRGIKQEPGIYVGNLLIKSNSEMKKIPIIAEIETKEILFDANVEIPIEQKQIEQGKYLNARVILFNLKRIGLTNLNMEYFVKDIFGNTVITETESVTIETQTSFVKTIHIPKNLNPGEYIFGAVARYGSSVGTSTLLFEVAEPEIKKKSLIEFYRDNQALSLIIIIGLAILVSFIGSHISFLTGAFIHGKVFHPFKERPQKSKKTEEKKIAKKEIKPKKAIKHKELKHKKLLLALLYLVIISFIIFYLFYSRVVTLAQLDGWVNDAAKSIQTGRQNIGIRDYAIKTGKFIKDYYSYIIASLMGVVLVLAGYLKRKNLIKSFEKLSEEIKKASKKEKIAISVLSAIILLITLAFLLFNYGILSAGQFSSLFSNIAVKVSEFGKSAANKALNCTKNLWKAVLYYTSPQRRYFYPAIASIIGFIAAVCFIIIAKKTYLSKRVRLWLEQKRVEIAKRRLAKTELKLKKVIEKKKVSKKEELANLYLKLSENFKRLTKKEKIIISIILAIVFLIIITSVLIALGRLSIEQLSISMWDIIGGIGLAFNTLLEWTIQHYLYILIIALVMEIIIFSCTKRDIIAKHKKLFLVLLGLAMISSIIACLFYSRIITLEKISYLWNSIISWLRNIAIKISGFGKNIADRTANLWNNTKNLWESILYYASPQRRHFYRVLGAIIGLAALICFMIIAKKTHLFKRLRAKLKQIKAERAEKMLQLKKEEEKIAKKVIKAGKVIGKKEAEIFKKITSSVTKHKKLFLVLLGLAMISSIIACLFYSRIITLEKISYLWNSIISWLRNIAIKISGFGKSAANKALNYTKNLWKAVLYYTSPQRRYFYPAIASIVGFMAIVCFIIIAKKTYLSGRVRLWLEQKRAEIAKRRLAKIELKLKKVIRKEKWGIFENFKKLSVKGKIVILVMLATLFLIIITSILIELGILSTKQLGIENIVIRIRLFFK